eukprot:TRINITY_DN15720_c0_g1_i1.p1 TRINITY_DN15720_c0_g1~~TRINITY_DN15720_c0_g1_i1.p1  ORF type:complete len:459 (-),score=25.70 TRINITY_DN15720_c0_g1_i1:263-1513(-)
MVQVLQQHPVCDTPVWAGKHLVRYGVAVVPFLDADDLLRFRSWLDHDMAHFPEYNPSQEDNIFQTRDEDRQYVFGPYGALSNPSSFHCPSARAMRQMGFLNTVDVVKAMNVFEQHPQRRLEMLYGSIRIKSKGNEVGDGPWLQDNCGFTKYRRPGDKRVGKGRHDVMIRGWVNLDLEEQQFVCIPGTHVDKLAYRDLIVSKKMVKKMGKNAWKLRKQRLEALEHVIRIPPGHQLLYNICVIHQVPSIPTMRRSYRVALSFRLTYSNVPICNNDSVMDKQGLPYRDTGSKPVMYSQDTWRWSRGDLVSWSERMLRSQVLVQRVVKSGKKKGTYYTVVPMEMHSLKEYGLPMYPPYTRNDRRLFRPSTTWAITHPFKTGASKTVRVSIIPGTTATTIADELLQEEPSNHDIDPYGLLA